MSSLEDLLLSLKKPVVISRFKTLSYTNKELQKRSYLEAHIVANHVKNVRSSPKFEGRCAVSVTVP